MKVAVTGSSGLIGTALVAALRAHGHEVIRLVRAAPAAGDAIAWDPRADRGALDPRSLGGVAAVGVPVPANGRSGEQHAGRRGHRRQRGRQRPCALYPAVADLGLVTRRPALVGEARPGQVHDGRHAVQRPWIQAAPVRLRVPDDRVRSPGARADQPDDVMAVSAQRGDQGGADQSRRPGDRNVHRGIQSPSSASKAPSSSRSFTVARKRAASAPSTSR